MSQYTFPAIIQGDIKKFNEMFGVQLFSKTAVLNAITAYVFGHKGKQLRPALVFLSARIFGEVTETTYSAAYMVELLHNATLIHDDVVDDAEKRRNLLSVKFIWKNKESRSIPGKQIHQMRLSFLKNSNQNITKIFQLQINEPRILKHYIV